MTSLEGLKKQQTELAGLKAFKLNRSRIFTRAHYLVKKQYMTLSEALKQCYKEYREYKAKVKVQIEQLTNHIIKRYNVTMFNSWNIDESINNINFNPLK